MKRLFVAIDFPEAIKSQIKPLCADLMGAKWVAQHQMHLTLRFIGDADDKQLTQIQTGLATIQATPFKMTLQGVGQFPAKGNPRVVWVGVEAEPALNQLQQKVEQVIQHCGFEQADHPFSPHITLARFRTPPSVEQVENYFERHQTFKSNTFNVGSFVLYSSQLASSGSIYQQEGLYSLI